LGPALRAKYTIGDMAVTGPHTEPTVIPVAGGKGGVGKTLLAANLAVTLAYAGYRTAAVDLDLGGSNLHLALGLPNRFPGVGDFLRRSAPTLDEFLVPTAVEGLSFVPGDGRTPFLANVSVADKARVIRAVSALPAQFVIIDLGAGSSFNTLDFFRMVGAGLVVTTPEPTAVMNLMTFCKNLVYRAVSQAERSNPDVEGRVRAFFDGPLAVQGRPLTVLFEEVSTVCPEAARRMADRCRQLRPRLVFNRGRHPSQLQVVASMERLLAERLSLRLEPVGFVFDDEAVGEAVASRRVLVQAAPNSLAALGIVRLAKRLTRIWHGPILNARSRLERDTQKFFEAHVQGHSA